MYGFGTCEVRVPNLRDVICRGLVHPLSRSTPKPSNGSSPRAAKMTSRRFATHTAQVPKPYIRWMSECSRQLIAGFPTSPTRSSNFRPLILASPQTRARNPVRRMRACLRVSRLLFVSIACECVLFCLPRSFLLRRFCFIERRTVMLRTSRGQGNRRTHTSTRTNKRRARNKKKRQKHAAL